MYHLDMLVAPLSRSGEQRFSTWTYQYYEQWEWYTMPRKKANGAGATGKPVSGSNGELKWLNIRLEEEDIAAVIALADSDVEFGNELVALVAGGGNFSVKLDTVSGEYAVFVSDSRGDDTSNRYGMSGRAKTAKLAISAVLIKLRLWKSAPDRFTQSGEGLGIR